MATIVEIEWHPCSEEYAESLKQQFNLVGAAHTPADCWCWYNEDDYRKCTNIFDIAPYLRASMYEDTFEGGVTHHHKYVVNIKAPGIIGVPPC